MSDPASPAPSSAHPRRSGLRPIALAVVVLAVLDVLLRFGHAGLLLAAQRSQALEIAAQVSPLGTVVVSSLLAAAVVLLVRRAAGADGRVPTPALLALGLLALVLLARPLSAMLTNLVYAAASPGGAPGPATRMVPLVTDGLAVLCTLGLGLVALLLAVRGEAPARTDRPAGPPSGLAAALCGLALVAALLLPGHLLAARFVVSDSPAVALLAGMPALLAGLAQVLLVPVGALLIARAAARPRRVTWAVLIVLWVGALLTTLAVRLLLLQLALGAGPEVFGLWNGLSIAVQLLVAVSVLVLAVVVLVQVRASRRDPAGTAASR